MLGASEKQPKDNGDLRELRDPREVANREFAEELLILKEKPVLIEDGVPTTAIVRPFYISNATADAQALSNEFNKAHKELRNNYDNLILKEDKDWLRINDNFKTNMRLKVISKDGLVWCDNVLVCFNLLELGIEVVKIVEFEIDETNYLLDGEILSNNEVSELVRMPMALIPYDSLEEIFKGDIFKDNKKEEGLAQLVYQVGVTNPSVDVAFLNDKRKEEFIKNIILFDYDLQRRSETLEKETDVGSERIRYTNAFKKYFDKSTNTVQNDKILSFTPATVKILNLLFNQSKD